MEGIRGASGRGLRAASVSEELDQTPPREQLQQGSRGVWQPLMVQLESLKHPQEPGEENGVWSCPNAWVDYHPGRPGFRNGSGYAVLFRI